MKVNRVNCVSVKSSKELFAYGGKLLAIIGSFKADIYMSLYNGKSENTDFLVIQNEALVFMGRHSCPTGTFETLIF